MTEYCLIHKHFPLLSICQFVFARLLFFLSLFIRLFVCWTEKPIVYNGGVGLNCDRESDSLNGIELMSVGF